ncbi:hypothetical protein G6L13_09645 [Agrobacterium tumefaciens]|uniref:hypothetical protein n=1 Tax=Agrobacterium tumefaciens TaxID=358 RepID=UPI000DD070DF|nr:hypothetical protein [Agrobacterium tumefaciens]NTA80748.1 hypothetical protein [Agrobacterium tumefaciens]
MALPQVHVICGYAGGDGNAKDRQPLFKDPQWSEEPASNTPTTKAAPDINGMIPVFRVTNTVDIYVSHAVVPNAANSPRHVLLAANAPHDLYVKPGDKFSWVAA